MTTHIKIGAEAPRKEYTANGTQTAFPFDFAVFQAIDVEVRVNGAVVASGFAVAVGADGRGTVNFTAAPASGARVTLLRRLTVQRQTDFQEGGELRAKTLNDELDFQTASIQQVAHDASRAVRLSDADPAALDMRLPGAATRAGQLLGFDADGRIVARAESGGASLIIPLSVAQGGTGATSAATARAALGAEDAALNHAYLDAVQAFTQAQRYAPATLSDAPGIDWNLDTQTLARVTLAGNRTMNSPSHQRDGGGYVLIVQQDATGGRSLAWSSAYDFGIEGTPSLPLGANKVAIFAFLNSGALMRCVGRWSN
ncbi:MAG: phage tail fiber protein [Tagaea sp.]|nr:phage tail fiber protein [Tagaea sp.]